MFLKTVMQNVCVYLTDGGLIYSFMDRRKLSELEDAARELGLSLIDLCFWDKGTGGMGSFYRSQHEPVYVFKFGKAPHKNYVQLGRFGRYRTNVWKYPGLSAFGRGRLDALSMHPTVKPVALCAEAIKDCTRRGDIVLDPFAGSGSTIIAAIKSGRIGYGIELEPRYCDVIVQRFEKLTGKPAVLEKTGLTFAHTQEIRRSERQNQSDDSTPVDCVDESPNVRIRFRKSLNSVVMGA